VDAAHGPAPLLANQAGQVVELTVVGPGAEGAPAPLVRRVVVPTLANERPLRYQAWVNANRDWVHEATGGRAGYVHVPDMMPRGWSQFHRLYLSEMERGALVVDARFNGGGHISALVLEKLARKVIGWAVPRRGAPEPYPAEAPLGPIVALVNEWAGSDGDIFTQGFKLLGLGPVVGARTWGGVIGIDPFQRLVDGALTTQPHVAFWFTDAGWAVENYGSDPTEEVLVTPQDYAAGRDPQLARAVELALGAVAGHHAPRPDLDARPRRPLPVLPAR
jgi:tricorn protease